MKIQKIAKPHPLNLKRLSLLIFSVLLLCIVSYLYGIYSYPRNLWPLEALRGVRNSTQYLADFGLGNYDSLGRLSTFPGKIKVNCPEQSKDTGVLLIAGQSNSANFGEKKFTTKYPDRVLNFHNDECFIASSPLLGSTGEGGEFITLLADKLIESDTYKSVILVSTGFDGSHISRWEEGGDINQILLNTISRINKKYAVNIFIWHQGEADFRLSTSSRIYAKSFRSLLRSIEQEGVRAKTFISIATRCGFNPNWKAHNPTALGQASLIDNKKIFLGANTDELITETDRQPNNCHFSTSGQELAARAFANSIIKSKK